MTSGDTVLEGRQAIGEMLAQLIAMKLRIATGVHRLVYLDESALLRETWQIRHPAGDSDAERLQVTNALALHRHIDGEGWKIAFLAPWGFD